jgi:hypothetical protein
MEATMKLRGASVLAGAALAVSTVWAVLACGCASEENPGSPVGDACTVSTDCAKPLQCLLSLCLPPGAADAARWPLPPISKAGGGAGYTLSTESVIDDVTQLEWTRGETDEAADTWVNAVGHCSFGSMASGGWRLPERIELMTLVDYGKSSAPLIDTTAFPEAKGDGYWTRSESADDDTVAWAVDFSVGGAVSLQSKQFPYHVRCVRPALDRSGWTGRYEVDASAATVKDTWTGLTWEQAESVGALGLTAGRSYCSSLTTAGGGWRLPNILELASLVSTGTTEGPTIDTASFTGATGNSFWSDTMVEGLAGQTWLVDFSDGHAVSASPYNSYVRCVR